MGKGKGEWGEAKLPVVDSGIEGDDGVVYAIRMLVLLSYCACLRRLLQSC